jgi:hypothetical protein
VSAASGTAIRVYAAGAVAAELTVDDTGALAAVLDKKTLAHGDLITVAAPGDAGETQLAAAYVVFQVAQSGLYTLALADSQPQPLTGGNSLITVKAASYIDTDSATFIAALAKLAAAFPGGGAGDVEVVLTGDTLDSDISFLILPRNAGITSFFLRADSQVAARGYDGFPVILTTYGIPVTVNNVELFGIQDEMAPPVPTDKETYKSLQKMSESELKKGAPVRRQARPSLPSLRVGRSGLSWARRVY